jgi:(p)ppGpp synthase/HD superfamily hydrolase
MNMVSQAKEFATLKHSGQFRKFSGEAYVEHPKRVAQTILRYKNSKELDKLMAAALLHDTIEDTETSLDEVKTLFGDLVASLVEELTSDKELKVENKAEYLAQKMSGMTSWALVIKLADRLDNVSDLRHVNKSFRIKYIKETKYIISQLIMNREYLSATHLQLVNDILKEVNGVAKIDKIF